MHRERGGRVRGGRRAVGAGHRDGGRAGRTAVAAGTAAVDQRGPGHGPRDARRRPVAGDRGRARPAPGGRAHVVRPAARVRVRRRRPRDRGVRRGRGPVARDPAAGDGVRGPSPARRAPPDGRGPGRQQLRVLHVPAERHGVRAGRVVPRDRGPRVRGRGGRETGGHARAGHGPRHRRVLPHARRRGRVGVGREPEAGRAQLPAGAPWLHAPDAHRGGGRLAERRVVGRVQLRRVRDRQRGLHRSQDVVATGPRCGRLLRRPRRRRVVVVRCSRVFRRSPVRFHSVLHWYTSDCALNDRQCRPEFFSIMLLFLCHVIPKRYC